MKSNRWLGVVAGLVVAAASGTASADDAAGASASGSAGSADASASLTFGASSTDGTTTASTTTASTTTDGTPPPAAPQSTKSDSFNRTFAFGVSGGIGSPLGYGGLLVNVAPIKYLILEVGAGAGGRFGPAIAEMVRGGIPDGNQMFSLGLGLSQNITTSGIRDKFDPSMSDSVPGISHFLNVEAAYEYRFVQQRFWGRLGVGIATLLNADKYKGLCGANDVLCSHEETGFTPLAVAENKGTVTAYIHLDVGGFFGF